MDDELAMTRTRSRSTRAHVAALLGAWALGCPGSGGGDGSTSGGTVSPSTGDDATTAASASADATATMTASGSGSGSGSATGSGSADDTSTDTGEASCERYFPADSIWYSDHSDAPVHPNSDAIVAWLEGAGWGGGDEMRIDFSIEVLEAGPETPRMPFEATGDFYTPDCDFVPVPVPEGGALEGEEGYACTNDGDCHLIVFDCTERRLYEMWRANIDGGTFYGGCLAVWETDMVYPETGRGDGCTSADAAGFPIAPLLFTADEVAAGQIDHAIRFILPNENIRHYIYTRPATHSTGPTSAPAPAPPYGVHLRLRDDYPLDSLPSDGARVVARAMQTHGMFLADGGQITLTAQSDRFTTAKWAGLLDSYDLSSIRPNDFQVIDWGPDLDWEQVECTREPLGGSP
jgi:serine/threonine-protein kinase